MSDSPLDFDLKFLPDWMKEAPSTNRYADYEGDTGDRPRRDRDDRRGPPRGDGRPPRRDAARPPQGDRNRGPRPGGPRPPGGDRPRGDAPRGAGARNDRRPSDRPRDDDRRSDAPRPAPAQAPAELRVEFLPEPNAAAGIAKQIRSSMRAYAVFSTAKLFLDRPERHRVRITSSKPEVPLFQIEGGPVSFDRAAVERGAFQQARDEYYASETVQGDPIKGNFSNVARCRSTGTLLGPTNHHSYQPALRKIYEERFSRRISFQQFQQEEIEVIASEQAVADWKEQARTTTTYTTTKEAEPMVFKTMSEAEQHFRKTYLPTLVKSGTTLECDGPASRVFLDRHVNAAVRNAWEQERVFPQGVVNGLRHYFGDAGLHYFKHRKRILHVSAVKPLRHVANQTFSDSITGILNTVDEHPRIKRPDLARRLLGAGHDAPEAVPRKAQLAADVHYLVQMGHLIEFSDSSFDLPLGPKGEQPLPSRGAAPASEASVESDAGIEDPSAAEGATVAGDTLVAEDAPVDESPIVAVEEMLVAEAPVAKVIAEEPVLATQEIPATQDAVLEAEAPDSVAATQDDPLPTIWQQSSEAEIEIIGTVESDLGELPSAPEREPVLAAKAQQAHEQVGMPL